MVLFSFQLKCRLKRSPPLAGLMRSMWRKSVLKYSLVLAIIFVQVVASLHVSVNPRTWKSEARPRVSADSTDPRDEIWLFRRTHRNYPHGKSKRKINLYMIDLTAASRILSMNVSCCRVKKVAERPLLSPGLMRSHTARFSSKVVVVGPK
ncbi:hypothetical protein BDR26DRAFT_173991 [Obelidium mucronatum]|nr:hypothetical protein BDR26DRAFT_173991 [Obelidium mucronatum]